MQYHLYNKYQPLIKMVILTKSGIIPFHLKFIYHILSYLLISIDSIFSITVNILSMYHVIAIPLGTWHKIYGLYTITIITFISLTVLDHSTGKNLRTWFAFLFFE